MKLNSDARRALEFMELNLILGTDFDTYAQFYAYAKKEYSMSAESLLSSFTFKELADLIKIAVNTSNEWLLVSINKPITYNKVYYKTKRKLLYSLNLTQKEFFVRLLESNGDMEKSLEPKSKTITFFGKDYYSFEDVFQEYNSSVPNIKNMHVPFDNLNEYLQHLEESYVLVNDTPLISLKQLCIAVRSTSELLLPVFKYYKKNGSLDERQQSFDDLLERFHQAQKEYMRDSGTNSYGSVTQFSQLYKRTPSQIMKIIYAPQPYHVIAMSLRFGESYGLKLSNHNRKVIYQNSLSDFTIVADKLGITGQQLNEIIISGFSNSFVEQRLIELAWKKGIYDFEIFIVDSQETNPFLDTLLNIGE